jgi:hypothetical protein
MEHGSHYVDVLDESGEVIGKKLRKEIDKRTDIYNTTHILLITPQGEVVLSLIKERNDLPNLYSGHYGATIATINRSGEIPEEAARRAISRELFIDHADVHFVGEGFEATPQDALKSFISFFYFVGEPPATFSKTDLSTLVRFSPNDVSRQLAEHPNEFAPIFTLLWEKYSDLLPL